MGKTDLNKFRMNSIKFSFYDLWVYEHVIVIFLQELVEGQ